MGHFTYKPPNRSYAFSFYDLRKATETEFKLDKTENLDRHLN